jgi:hypothetical protein
MVVNFKTREINRGTCKLIQTPTLIIIEKNFNSLLEVWFGSRLRELIQINSYNQVLISSKLVTKTTILTRLIQFFFFFSESEINGTNLRLIVQVN